MSGEEFPFLLMVSTVSIYFRIVSRTVSRTVSNSSYTVSRNRVGNVASVLEKVFKITENVIETAFLLFERLVISIIIVSSNKQ